LNHPVFSLYSYTMSLLTCPRSRQLYPTELLHRPRHPVTPVVLTDLLYRSAPNPIRSTQPQLLTLPLSEFVTECNQNSTQRSETQSRDSVPAWMVQSLSYRQTEIASNVAI